MLAPKKNEVRKPVKTISGIAPVAVMLPPRKCNHGACVYCPSLDVPQSYTPKSPAVLRAKMFKYDAFEQVKARVKSYKVMNHPTDKIELIIMGGTFLEYPEKFQKEFVKKCYDALNSRKSKTLEEAQKRNEKAKHRCIALCIETRPDTCSDKEVEKMRSWGATRVELGVQIIDDTIYKKIKRGHTVQDVVDATKRLRNAGFKIGYHIMPGLPGSTPAKDLKLFKKIFSDERFKPDQLKLYPCQVMPGSELEKWYWAKKFKPYTKEQIEKVLIEMLKAVPRYCRVMRVMREIPPDYLVAGTIKIDLRKTIEEKFRQEGTTRVYPEKFSKKTFTKGKEEMREKGTKLKEIRYREIGFNKVESLDLKLKATKYKASGGDEYFLEIVNSEDILFGLLRLRILDSLKARDIIGSRSLDVDFSLKKKLGDNKSERKIQAKQDLKRRVSESERVGIIRELHVYGQALKLGARGDTQHRGLGKRLIKKAEEICREKKIGKLKIISGIGVRDYYKKLGYKLDGTYVVKNL